MRAHSSVKSVGRVMERSATQSTMKYDGWDHSDSDNEESEDTETDTGTGPTGSTGNDSHAGIDSVVATGKGHQHESDVEGDNLPESVRPGGFESYEKSQDAEFIHRSELPRVSLSIAFLRRQLNRLCRLKNGQTVLCAITNGKDFCFVLRG